MTPRRIPVTLIVVDSGPLISLAACERLELLDSFDRKVRITDVVRGECLRFPDKPGGAVLRRWFADLPGHAEVLSTPFLTLWQDAVTREDAGDETRPSKGIGDASVTWLLQRLLSRGPTEEIILVLSDDAPLGDGILQKRHPEIYMLSTRAFLQVLANFGVGPSVPTVMREILEAGRAVSRYTVDRPGRLSPGVKSSWTDGLSEAGLEPHEPE